MDIATSQFPRMMRLALIGAATAFAWIVLSLVLGLGHGQAQADERDDSGVLGGALGVVTSAVDSTAASVTGTVAAVTQGVTATVNTVVSTAPAPIQAPAAEVVQSVGAVVATVTQPLAPAVSEGVVSAITEPVVDLVTDVPIVGGVVTGIGLDDAVRDLSGTVDTTLGGVVGAVDEAGATLGPSPRPGMELPTLPVLPGASWPSAQPGAAAIPAAVDAVPLFSPSAALGGFGRWTASVFPGAIAPVAAVSSAPNAGDPSSPAGGLCLPSASTGPGGAGPGAWALAALLPLVAHRAWVRRAGPEDEHAPPAPAGLTDVSPD